MFSVASVSLVLSAALFNSTSFAGEADERVAASQSLPAKPGEAIGVIMDIDTDGSPIMKPYMLETVPEENKSAKVYQEMVLQLQKSIETLTGKEKEAAQAKLAELNPRKDKAVAALRDAIEKTGDKMGEFTRPAVGSQEADERGSKEQWHGGWYGGYGRGFGFAYGYGRLGYGYGFGIGYRGYGYGGYGYGGYGYPCYYPYYGYASYYPYAYGYGYGGYGGYGYGGYGGYGMYGVGMYGGYI